MGSLFGSQKPPKAEPISIPALPAMQEVPKPDPPLPKYRQSSTAALEHTYGIFKELGVNADNYYGTHVQPIANRLYTGELEEGAARQQVLGIANSERESRLNAERAAAEEAHQKRLAELKQPNTQTAAVQNAVSESTRRRARGRGYKATILASRMMDEGALATTLGS
jgi:hypothetical protein